MKGSEQEEEVKEVVITPDETPEVEGQAALPPPPPQQVDNKEILIPFKPDEVR